MVSDRPKLLLLLTLSLLAGMSACLGKKSVRESLSIDRTSPALDDPSKPVLLNEALTIYFSEPILPTSVTSDSVSLIDESGHKVSGQLRAGKAGNDWVQFVPDPPLAADLGDGSFRPGAHYRLVFTGRGRVDRVKSQDGRRSLPDLHSFDIYIADRNQAPVGLPSILRPPASDLPLMMRTSDGPVHVAADVPRLLLHFTLPILPTSLRSEAFRIRLQDGGILVPRGVRAVPSPFDKLDFPGSTVEIDLGSVPRLEDGTSRPLTDMDFISVVLVSEGGLVDYAGRSPLPGTHYWSVVEGRSVPICGWPDGEQHYSSEDELQAGFEVRGANIVPKVRIEAGNGSLGAFRPKKDTTLRPGESFDRGDGLQVVSSGPDFHFASIDIPADVTVTVDASSGPVRLLATGGMRLEGSLGLIGPATPLPARAFISRPVADLVSGARVALVAAGDVQIYGEITSSASISESETALLLATAGWLRLHGELPFQSVLVADSRGVGSVSRIEGVRGQSKPYPAAFTVGLAAGAEITFRGVLPWRQLPSHLDSGVLQIGDVPRPFVVEWQATSADAIRRERPDLRTDRIGRWQPARDRDVLVVGGGGFVRLKLTAVVREGEPLPSIRELRLVEN